MSKVKYKTEYERNECVCDGKLLKSLTCRKKHRKQKKVAHQDKVNVFGFKVLSANSAAILLRTFVIFCTYILHIFCCFNSELVHDFFLPCCLQLSKILSWLETLLEHFSLFAFDSSSQRLANERAVVFDVCASLLGFYWICLPPSVSRSAKGEWRDWNGALTSVSQPTQIRHFRTWAREIINKKLFNDF